MSNKGVLKTMEKGENKNGLKRVTVLEYLAYTKEIKEKERRKGYRP